MKFNKFIIYFFPIIPIILAIALQHVRVLGAYDFGDPIPLWRVAAIFTILIALSFSISFYLNAVAVYVFQLKENKKVFWILVALGTISTGIGFFLGL